MKRFKKLYSQHKTAKKLCLSYKNYKSNFKMKNKQKKNIYFRFKE
jgi:hypothetical protein